MRKNQKTSAQKTPAPAFPADPAGPLLYWYDRHRRILPWREDPTPYHVWVSEIMLQQTRVEAVIPYYERFMKRLPDINALASVPEDTLLKLWEGLGYYSRARNLKKAAGQIVKEYGGALPSDPKELAKLSGIGVYTAAAIASIAYQIPVPSVDGNLLRVYARLTAYAESINNAAVKKNAEQAFSQILSQERPGDMNQAFMDLGATICLPNGMPLCERCPLADMCIAHRNGIESELPRIEKKTGRPIERKTVFLIRRDHEILLRKRPERGLLAGLWEFPNETGHLSEEEAGKYCSAMGLQVQTIRRLPSARHIFTHLTWDMVGYEVCVTGTGTFIPIRKLLTEYAIPSAFSSYTGYLSAASPQQG